MAEKKRKRGLTARRLLRLLLDKKGPNLRKEAIAVELQVTARTIDRVLVGEHDLRDERMSALRRLAAAKGIQQAAA